MGERTHAEAMKDLEEFLSEMDGDETESFFEELKKEAEEDGITIRFGGEKRKFEPKLTYNLSENLRKFAVRQALIPKLQKDAKFDTEYIKNSVMESIKGTMYRVEKFDEYERTCCSILSDLRLGKLPSRSWLIGAPDGFGKTTFVSECILTMAEKCMDAVPFISLYDLYTVSVMDEQRLLKPFYYKEVRGNQYEDGYTYLEPKEPDYIKLPKDVVGSYSWQEYMHSSCLFCYFTGVLRRDAESRILYEILKTRGARCLPTIVMMSTSLNPYLKDRVLKEQVWDEILDTSPKAKDSYDRVLHVSTYKVRRNPIEEKEIANRA